MFLLLLYGVWSRGCVGKPKATRLRDEARSNALHGPNALIDETLPVVVIATEGDQHIHQLVEHVLEIPAAPELLLPILEVVPLLAYHIALRRGCDVDQPRNLAKSVTAE